MANTFITPSVIARRALATLYNSTVLAALVHRDYDEDFNGNVGDTISVRKPAVFSANEFNRTTGIVLQDATESSFPVKLDTLLDVSFAVTAEDLSLRIDDFSTRLLNPAMEAINQSVDLRLADELINASEVTGGGGLSTWNGTAASSVFTSEKGAKARLSRNKAPTTERYAVFSPEGVGVCLTDALFVQAQQSGSTDGLREASIGRVFGFDTYETQQLGFGSSDVGQTDGVSFHRDAVALVSRTLSPPIGIPQSQMAVESYKGLGLRVVKQYDINKKQDLVSVDFLLGVKTIRKEHSVQLSFGIGS